MATHAAAAAAWPPPRHLLPRPPAQVEFPDGRTALCLLPAKFHKKLWVKKGNYLVVEGAAEEDTRVTGEISAVLFADHVKQLKRMPGVW